MSNHLFAGVACFSALASLIAAQPPASLVEPAPPGTQAAKGRLASSKTAVQAVVRLRDLPLAATLGANAKRTGIRLTRQQQQAYLATLAQKQTSLSNQIAALGGQEMGRLAKGHNALIVEIPPAQLNRLTSLPGVAGVRLLGNYHKALSTTVPYIGAAALHTLGQTGAGVKIAVLDSGVDYTHRNLGGPGTLAAYTAAYGLNPASLANKTRDGLFPTSKVYEGFDFVGDVWPNGPRAPDPDPIDFEGHGTHVADIAAGKSLDNTHKGVAPDAQLLAVKVCSSVSTDCSGIAILLGLDFALDPNGDGDLSDSVDVINLSLGTDYGMREDDAAEVLRIASAFGVTCVVAAGNAADRPYIVGAASTAPAAISVAQTQVPDAKGYPLTILAPPSIAGTYTNTEVLSFAPVGAGFSAQIVFIGRGCPAGSIDGVNPDDPFLANPAGKVALIDRGACNVSEKVGRATAAGAVGVLIGLVAPGDAVGFSFGGGGPAFAPSLVITQATSNLIKANPSAIGALNPFAAISLAGSMAGSSSRGPGSSYNAIKPELGAPGASISAEAGTGNGESAFSGTSGATPMVAGSAALLLQACPLCSPYDIKARLMNTAEINILTNPKTLPGELAPIARIGAGETRVDRARNVRTLASDAADPSSAGLSFGTMRLSGNTSLSKKVLVRNLDSVARSYSVVPEFRFADDAASGAVTLSAPPTIAVPANGTGTFTLTLTIQQSLLPTWTMNGGSQGGNGAGMRPLEFDGFVRISDATDTIRVPWYFLPHKAALQAASTGSLQLANGAGSLSVSNLSGTTAGNVVVFSLLGTSPQMPVNTLPRPGDNFAVVDLRAIGIRFAPDGAGAGQDVVQFAVSTFGERAHPNNPAEFDVFIDVDSDGSDDYVAFNGESGGRGATGQNVVSLFRFSDSSFVTRFFSTADLNSSNLILNILRNDLLTAANAPVSPGTKIGLTFCAGDNYYTGLFTDCAGPVSYTLNTPRFTSSQGSFTLGPLLGQSLAVTHNPAGNAASPSQSGFLLFYGNARSGKEAEIVTILP